MPVVKNAASVVEADLVNGALFDADSNLLGAGDLAESTYVYTTGSGPGNGTFELSAAAGSDTGAGGRNFLLTRSSPTDESDPTLLEVQNAGYAITELRPYDAIVVTLGSSRRVTFIVNAAGTGVLATKTVERIDGALIDAAGGAPSFPSVAGYRDGDYIVVINASDPADNNVHVVVDDGTRQWVPAISTASTLTAGNGISLTGGIIAVKLDAVTGNNELTVGSNGLYSPAGAGGEVTHFIDSPPGAGLGAIGDQALVNFGNATEGMLFKREAGGWEYAGQISVDVTTQKSSADKTAIANALTTYGGGYYRYRLLDDDTAAAAGLQEAGIYQIDSAGVRVRLTQFTT